MWKRLLYIVLPFVLLIGPLIMGYIFSVYITLPTDSSNFVLGLYFFMLFFYLLVQYVAALLHYKSVNRRKYNMSYFDGVFPRVSILVVGYMENKDYFSACIKSLDNQTYDFIESIVFVNDSDDVESKYMNEIVETEMERSKCKVRNLCIEHKGKRHAMYRGFEEIENDESEFILTLDSDTILAPDCVERMLEMVSSDVGGVTGNVKIFNSTKIISFISMLRYFFAFNVERAAQSYFGVVNCISGPLGLYRKSIISEAKRDWLNQTFLGNECTYGDDRHLTFQVLKRGWRVYYTHLAEAYTETPESLTRWFKQQTRWNKSSIRELNWIVSMLEMHSFWLALELVYVLCYHIIVFCSLLYVIFGKDLFYVATWLGVIFILTFLKSFMPMFLEGDIKFLLFPVYNLLFIFAFIPSKIYALLTMRDTDWGTSTRRVIRSESILVLYPIGVWCMILLGGFLYNVIVLTEHTIFNWVYFVCVISVYVIWVLLAKWCTFYSLNLEGVMKKYDIIL